VAAQISWECLSSVIHKRLYYAQTYPETPVNPKRSTAITVPAGVAINPIESGKAK
jgi:hypothetical protein